MYIGRGKAADDDELSIRMDGGAVIYMRGLGKLGSFRCSSCLRVVDRADKAKSRVFVVEVKGKLEWGGKERT